MPQRSLASGNGCVFAGSRSLGLGTDGGGNPVCRSSAPTRAGLVQAEAATQTARPLGKRLCSDGFGGVEDAFGVEGSFDGSLGVEFDGTEFVGEAVVFE